MTASLIPETIAVLQGFYPSEAYKLDGVLGKQFSSMLLMTFSKTDNAVFQEALARVCKTSERLPSIAMLVKAVQEIRNTVPVYQALPEGPVDPRGKEKIAAILEAAKQNSQQSQNRPTLDADDPASYGLSSEIVDFARRLFPGITLQQIADNVGELEWNYSHCGKLDGHPLRLFRDQKTGLIYNLVRI